VVGRTVALDLLYIARELAERVGGSLEVLSVPSGGAEFVLALPSA
jgi:signal transduction histidine kinase